MDCVLPLENLNSIRNNGLTTTAPNITSKNPPPTIITLFEDDVIDTGAGFWAVTFELFFLGTIVKKVVEISQKNKGVFCLINENRA